MDKSIKISLVLLVIIVSLIFYFDKLYVINNYEDLKDTLIELDAYPYKDEEIFKVS